MSLKLLILAYFRASTLNNVVIKIELSHYDLFSSEKFEIWPTSNCTSQRCHKTRRWLSDSFVYRAAPNRCKHSRMAQSSAWCHWARLYNRRRWWCCRSKRVMQWKLILRLCKKKVNPPGTFLTLHLIISASLSAAAPKLCTNNAAIVVQTKIEIRHRKAHDSMPFREVIGVGWCCPIATGRADFAVVDVCSMSLLVFRGEREVHKVVYVEFEVTF